MDATLTPPMRNLRLRTATCADHERLDRLIMAADPFAARENYARFLCMQYRFHRDIAPLFSHVALAAVVPNLTERSRLESLVQDLADLGLRRPPQDCAPLCLARADLATGLGWLYVAEGSNLGAAILLRRAAALGLGAYCGARHLAGHPEGRAHQWRGFTFALNALPFDQAMEERLVQGARNAFTRVQMHAEHAFAK